MEITKEDFKSEIVNLLSNKVKYQKDNSEGLDNYWEIAEEITKLI